MFSKPQWSVYVKNNTNLKLAVSLYLQYVGRTLNVKTWISFVELSVGSVLGLIFPLRLGIFNEKFGDVREASFRL